MKMGKNIIFIIIIISIAILLLAISIPIYLFKIEKKLPETYDCYLLSIFWTPTSCTTKKSDNAQCFQTIKELGIDKYFTIHGLWPSTLEGIVPPACNEGFEDKLVQPNFDSNPEYKNKMEHYWPGLYNGNANLWKHEYNKHGYCYMKRNYLNFIDDYQIYFNKSIELFENGYRGLMDEILPDMRGLYNISKKKLKTMFSKSSLKLDNYSTYCLVCDNDTNLLTEIYFIFDLNFNRTKQKIHQENCPDVFKINFTDQTKMAIWDKYDYYAFVVQYSPDVCVWNGEACYEILSKKKDYKIGIHGLWPSYTSGVIPKECNVGEDIEIQVDEEDDYFKNYILNHWYSLYKTDSYFLTHEYNTHGYCYNERNGVNVSQYNIYLNQTMDIFNQYNFSSMLDDFLYNLPVGESLVKKSAIIEELEKRYQKDSFALRCYNYQNKSYLNEIYFKLDLEFKLMTEAKIKDTCGDEISINKLDRAD